MTAWPSLLHHPLHNHCRHHASCVIVTQRPGISEERSSCVARCKQGRTLRRVRISKASWSLTCHWHLRPEPIIVVIDTSWLRLKIAGVGWQARRGHSEDHVSSDSNQAIASLCLCSKELKAIVRCHLSLALTSQLVCRSLGTACIAQMRQCNSWSRGSKFWWLSESGTSGTKFSKSGTWVQSLRLQCWQREWRLKPMLPEAKSQQSESQPRILSL